MRSLIVVLLLAVTADFCVAISPKLIVRDRSYLVGQPTTVTINNPGDIPITFCAEFGKKINGEIAPLPFQVLKERDKKWEVVLTSPDVGSLQSTVLLAGNSLNTFRFVLKEPGKYKVRLWYVKGDRSSLKCPLENAGKKDSSSFLVEAK